MNPEETYSAIENLLNEWQSQAEQKAIDSQKLVDDIAQVEVVAESQDRCVRVVVDSNGALTDLTLSEDMYDYEPGELAGTILDLFTQARSDGASWTCGTDPEGMLARCAAWERRTRLVEARTKAEELSVRLVGPLGVFFLPAFLALGIAPLLAHLMGGIGG